LFTIKICGITRVADALAAAEAGADSVGLNFHPGSPRAIDIETAEAIVDVLPPGVARVGVFVDASPAVVRETARRLKLDFVQLHGDEPPMHAAELCDAQVIRAFRLGQVGWAPLVEYLAECGRLQGAPAAVLVDASRPGMFGGTGQTVDWQLARAFHDLAVELPLVLAGGLTADNVGEGVSAVAPAAVDTASGVESLPGVKDAAKIAAFVSRAREAFAHPNSGSTRPSHSGKSRPR
jgi:phosphoribosylanthranilate isomerase